MKWFLIASVCLLCSTTKAWATAADDLYNKGVAALQGEQYADAAKDFDQLVAGYPTGGHVNDAKVSGGYAHLRAGEYDQAINSLASLAGDSTKPDYQATALYFTALAQFTKAQKTSDPTQAGPIYQQATDTLSQLITLCTSHPTPDNKAYLEQSIYYRALAEFLHQDDDSAEKDLLLVIQQFPGSRSLPDYYLRLGSLYMSEINDAVAAKKPADEIQPLIDKALAAFDQVSHDPNALVQANDANMSKAEVLFMVAQLSNSGAAGYEKALEAYRLVRRKQDMIPLQEARIQQLKAQLQASLQASPNSYSNDASLLIEREEGHLEELKNGADPIILALIRMAECYSNMKQPDEARTILHRLAKVSLPPDQQQEVDFQTLYSYVLGGQTQQADAALTDYLSKHGDDPNASSISYQIAGKLMDKKDLPGALQQVQRSLRDFPPGKGKYADAAIALEAQILTSMGRVDESKKIVDDFLASNPGSPSAVNLLLTRAQNEANSGDLNAALADYKAVNDNAAASLDLRAAGDAGYIQTLNTLRRYDDVIAEAKNFETQYPAAKALSSVELFGALALAQKHDPGAVAALQDVAKKYPTEEAAPYALFSVITVYGQQHNIPGMIQAANDLRTTFPNAYTFIISASDMVGGILEKEKKFDDVVALYQPLTTVAKPDIAATASAKIGDVWLAAAKSMGYYQSLPLAARPEAEKRLSAAEQAFVGVLKNFSDQPNAMGDAIEGLYGTAKLRRSWGMVKDADLEAYLTKLTAGLTSPDMQARIELAKAGLVFVQKNGAAQFPAALDRYKKIIAAHPGLTLTLQETNQFGDLLLNANDDDTAMKIYTDLLNNSKPSDQVALGDAYYGLGAAAQGQGDLPGAKSWFIKLKQTQGGGLWHPHYLDAAFGIALADEKSGQPADLDEAKQTYGMLMLSPAGGVVLQAKAMLGYGRLLEKQGAAIKPVAGSTDFAAKYYEEPSLIYGPAAPEQSAEGLYYSGQAYQNAGDKVTAKTKYDALLQTYATTAPAWAAKAQAAEAQL